MYTLPKTTLTGTGQGAMSGDELRLEMLSLARQTEHFPRLFAQWGAFGKGAERLVGQVFIGGKASYVTVRPVFSDYFRCSSTVD